MNLVQTLRRLGQQMSGWNNAIDSQSHQLTIIQKLYKKNGLDIVRTSFACPEQYEVFRLGTKEQVGYLRLRHGHFTVDFPDACAEEILSECPNGDGCFDTDERLVYMNKAMKAILKKLNNEQEVKECDATNV